MAEPSKQVRKEVPVLDIENLNIKDLSTLWSAITGKYLPSVIYKVRMVAFDSGDVRLRPPLIEEIQSAVQT